jgi:hypothetical protein
MSNLRIFKSYLQFRVSISLYGYRFKGKQSHSFRHRNRERQTERTVRGKLNYYRKSNLLRIEELHNLYSSPNIIKMITLGKIRWAGHVASMGRGGMHIGFSWESRKERDH